MIEIKGMAFGYKRQKLFDGLDLMLEPGNIYGLLGKNGAGKTTLLKLICGLRFPQAGECRVLGYLPHERHAGLLEDVCLISEDLYVPPVTPVFFERLYAPFYPRFDHGVFVEHLREPLAVVRNLVQLLKPGGKLYLATPNLTGWVVRFHYNLLRPVTHLWPHPEPPLHLYQFSRATVRRLLEIAGLEQVLEAPLLLHPVDDGRPLLGLVVDPGDALAF